MNSEKDDLQILVGWIAVKTSDVRSVAKNLNLYGLTEGNSDEIFPRRSKSQETEEAKKGDIFLCCCNAWSILLYNTFEFERDIDDLLVTLSSEFAEAQHFFIDTEYTFSVEWKLANNGVIVRSVSFGEELNIDGEMTDAEAFIDWERLEGNEENEERISLGSSEVLRVARQWSVDPIVENPHPHTGVIGHI
jgi:hypothetical protein